MQVNEDDEDTGDDSDEYDNESGSNKRHNADAWDRLVVKHRCPSSRDNFVLREGFVVKHYITDKLLRITDIHFWGGAHGVGGHTLTVESVDTPIAEGDESNDSDDSNGDKGDTDSQPGEEHDEGCLDDEQVYADETADLNDSYDRTSFCERCFINFTPEFVTWCFNTESNRTWVDLHRPYRGRQRLVRSKSSCMRCEAQSPTGRVLWKFVRQHFAFRAAASFWFELAHHPKFMETHVAMALEETGALVRG